MMTRIPFTGIGTGEKWTESVRRKPESIGLKT
jgi:hypothetical protein